VDPSASGAHGEAYGGKRKWGFVVAEGEERTWRGRLKTLGMWLFF
jgi:hypothetical protein